MRDEAETLYGGSYNKEVFEGAGKQCPMTLS